MNILIYFNYMFLAFEDRSTDLCKVSWCVCVYACARTFEDRGRVGRHLIERERILKFHL